MSTPLPPTGPAIRVLPGGITQYYNPYTGNWSSNQAYAARMTRAYRRGLSQSEARGHRRTAAGSESQRRRQRIREQFGMSPTELFGIGFQQRYGFSYNYWRRLLRNGLRELNSRRSPNARIKPQHVADVIQAYRLAGRDVLRPELRTWEAWTEVHIGEALTSTELYQDEHDNRLGAYYHSMRSSIFPIEFWFYH